MHRAQNHWQAKEPFVSNDRHPIDLARSTQRRLAVFAVAAACFAQGDSSAQTNTPAESHIPSVAGLKTFTIRPPQQPASENVRIEIVVSKSMDVDCNQHWLIGRLTRTPGTGDAAAVYSLANVQHSATLMGCPGASISSDGKITTSPPVRTARNIQVTGDGFFIPHDSTNSFFIQVPEAYSVRYRIWTAGAAEDAGRVR